MRILGWFVLGLVLLIGGAALVADVIVTGMVNRDPLRSDIDRLVDEALGRDASWGALGVGLFPPSLVIEDANVAGATAEADAFVEAARIELRLMLAPLVAGAIVLDSIVIEQATVRLELGDDGLVLPDFGSGGRDDPSDEAGSGGDGPRVAIRMVKLEDARLVFEDRRVSPPRGIELVDIDARLEGASLEESFSVDVSVEPAGGGRAVITGSAGIDLDLDLAFELSDFPLLALDPYLEQADELKGRLSGTGRIRGPAAAPREVSAVLEVADARLRFQDTVVEGPLSWELEHSGPWAAPRGRFRIDATRARASLAGVYEKVPGRPATITGRLVSKDGVLGFDDVELKIENAEAQGRVDFGKRLYARVRLAPVELGHWQPLLEPLQQFELSGRIASDEWEIWNEPLALKGSLQVDEVDVSGPAGRRFKANGRVIASEGKVRSEDFVLESAGQRLPVEIEITDLAGDVRYRVRAAGDEMDSNELLSSFAGRPDTLFGPLDFDGDLNGTLAGERSVLRALGGRTRFEITPGKLKGISILEATLKRFDEMRGGGLLGSLMRPGGGLAPQMRQFYKDEFLVLSANLELSGGVASTRDLLLRTEGYEFSMQGRIDLADLGLDARGEIKLGQELIRAIAESFGLKRIALMQPILIPIPRLRGTVTDPKPEPDFSFLLSVLASNLPGAQGVQQLLKGLDGMLQQPNRQP